MPYNISGLISLDLNRYLCPKRGKEFTPASTKNEGTPIRMSSLWQENPVQSIMETILMAETFEAYQTRILSYLGDEEPIGVQQATPSQLDRRLRFAVKRYAALRGTINDHSL